MNKLAAALMILTVCASNVALTQVSQLAVPFIGPDYIHLEYNATSPAGGWFKMKIVDPDNAETEILSLANGDIASFSGKFSQGIGANGNYKFGFAQRVWNGQQWVENGWEQAAFTLDNDAAGGTLLVDEELPPGLVLNDITVPEGKTLTLKGFYPHSPNIGTRVSVYGTVNLADAEFESYPGGVQGGFKYNSLHFDLHQATVISGVNGGHYSVNAAEISFDNCRNIVVDPMNSTTIGNVTNSGVVLGRLSKGVAVKAHDSSLYNSPDPYSYGNPAWMGAGELTMRDVMWSGLLEVRGGVVAINGCTFIEAGVAASISSAAALKMSVQNSVFNGNVSVSNSEGELISFTESVFNGPTYIYGRNIRFDACEFCPDSSGTHSVNLENRSDVEIRDSLFRGSLVFHNSSLAGLAQPRWSEASAPTPTIENNAFMGPDALAFGANGYGAPQIPIPLGRNYYGDSIGKYTFAPSDNWSYGFLPAETGYAAKAYPTTAFAPQVPLKAVPFTRTNRNNWPPQIWLNGHIIGQGTISHHSGGLSSSGSHILLKGRSTLLSLDLSCSEVTLGGVEFYAKLGDQTVTPVRAPVLRRDPTAAGARALRNNGTTVSFILPPAEKDQETVEVYYKSGTAVIPAYPEGDRLLLRGSAVFKDPPPRELRIWVVPIKVDGIIGTWGVGNASAVASQLQRDIPNMLPLEANDLQLINRLADPTGLAFNGLIIGETNRFNMSVRNGGADTEARLRLYLTPPGGDEILLGTSSLMLEPFATHYIAFDQLVTHAGIYEIRGVIDQVSPTDTNTANNERVWRFASGTTVSLSSSHYVMQLSGGGNYSYGTPLTVSVMPSPEYPYVFTGWQEGGITVSTNLQYSFEVTASRQLVATFSALINLPIRVLPDAGGTVSGAGDYRHGASATLTATPAEGYRFVCWYAPHHNRELSTALSYTFTVTEKIYIDARFALINDSSDDNGGGGAVDNTPLASVGTYEAALNGSAPFGGSTVATALGTMVVKITKTGGALSAKITLQNGTLSFKAKAWDQVAADGTATVTMTTRGGESLTLYVKGDKMWGEVSGGRFAEAINLDGGRNRFAARGDIEATTLLAGLRGSYAVALPLEEVVTADVVVNGAPYGVGYLSLTIGNKGVVKVAGVLADGTRVSRSLSLQSDGTSATIPLFVPLYSKKGSLSGRLALDLTAGTLKVSDATLLYWHNPGRRGIDGFTEMLEVCGGRFEMAGALDAAPLWLSALAGDVAYYVGDELYDWVGQPDKVPLNVNGGRLLITKGVKPKKISDRESGAVWYEYDEVNPTVATFSLAARSGIFKGKFTLWCDYEDAKGKLIHKGVNIPYSGIMVPRRDASAAALATGLGHCLVPETNPGFKALRLKRSREVRLEQF